MRVKNIMRNSFFSVITQCVLIFLGFYSTRVLNLYMGEALVGVNGVIANVLGILSVSELGFSNAIVFHLYRVLDEGEEEKTSALMNLYRKAYQIIALVIGISGLCFLPFIHRFMLENPFSLAYVRTLYLLWLARTVMTYLLSYRRSILIADQKEYVASIGAMTANILNYSAIIFLVKYTNNYLLALSLNIFFESVINITINLYVKKHYPFLKKYRETKIAAEDRKKVFNDMRNIFFSKLSIKVFTSTDNLIISGLIGVVINGLYNNYCMISNSVVNLVLAVSNSIQPTMANLFLEKDQQKDQTALRQTSFLFFLISAFVSSALIALMSPFVRELWLGEKYLLDTVTVVFIAMNVAITVMGSPLNMVMTVSGMFKIERNLSIAASLTNLVLSLLLAKPLGVCGVILGTVSGNLLCIIIRSIFFYRNYLKMPVGKFLLEMLSYAFLIAGESFLTLYVADKIGQPGSLPRFFLCCVACVIIPNGINVFLFFKSWRLRSLVRLFLHR